MPSFAAELHMNVLIISEFEAVAKQAANEIAECFPKARFSVYRSLELFEAAKERATDYDVAVVSDFWDMPSREEKDKLENYRGVTLAWSLLAAHPDIHLIGITHGGQMANPFHSLRKRAANSSDIFCGADDHSRMTGAHFGHTLASQIRRQLHELNARISLAETPRETVAQETVAQWKKTRDHLQML